MKTEKQINDKIEELSKLSESLLKESFELRRRKLYANSARKLSQMYKVEDRIKVLEWVLSDEVEGLNDPEGDYDV